MANVQEAISRRVTEPGFGMFRDARLVVVGIGTKLEEWKTPSLVATIDRSLTWFQQYFDPQYLDEEHVHVDVGKETWLPGATSLIWREDFLRLFASSLSACVADQASLKPTLYPRGFLRGVCDATIEPTFHSPLRQQGLSYIQHYASFKEVFAAGNTYPFSNEHLSNLTVSPEVLKTFQQLGRATSVKPEVLARAYIHSKVRSHHGLSASGIKSFGTRWECRIILPVVRQIRQHALHVAYVQPQHNGVIPTAWVAHPTEVLADWMRINLNKFCFAFESLFGRCQERPYIAWEHTQLMMLMLKCVSCFAGVLIPGTYPQLWKDVYHPTSRWRSRRGTRVANPQARHGLAIGSNMQALGYGWLADGLS